MITPEEIQPEEILPEEIPLAVMITPEEIQPEEIQPEEIQPEEIPLAVMITPEEIQPEEILPAVMMAATTAAAMTAVITPNLIMAETAAVKTLQQNP